MLGEVARRTTNLVVVTDAERRIEWGNAAFERGTGYTLAEAMGRNPGHLLSSPRTNSLTTKVIRGALDAGQPVRTEMLNRTAGGRDYWLDLDIQPLHEANGALRGFIAAETDNTEQCEGEEALRSSTRDAVNSREILGGGGRSGRPSAAWRRPPHSSDTAQSDEQCDQVHRQRRGSPGA